MLRKRPAHSAEETREVKSSPSGKAKRKGTSKKYIFALVLLAVPAVYIGAPLFIYWSPELRRHSVFLNYAPMSDPKNVSLPSESGLECTRNFYLNTADGIKVGVWHVPPRSALPRCRGDALSETEAFKDGRPIFLYLHGNSGSRGAAHRVELYKLLSEKVDVHVLAFDYRGYGDSNNVPPTESGVVEDTVQVYNWLRDRVNASRIFVWGHSLGTAIGVAALEKLSKSPHGPAAVILEAPFTKVSDVLRRHPLSIFHRFMPFFETMMAVPFDHRDTAFDSIGRIGRVRCPLLILHAEDDWIIPFELGKRLHEEALISRRSSRSKRQVRFVSFEGKFSHGHKYICRNPDLPQIVKEFLEIVDSDTD